MPEIVNAKGLACPQPVLLTKKALEDHSDVDVLVDNAIAVENVKRFAANAGWAVEVTDESGGIFRIHLKKQDETAADNRESECISCADNARSAASGPSVFVIVSDTMGKGSDELGTILMKSFIHTAIDLEDGPDVMIFYNSGVKLAVEGSDVLDDLKKIEGKGVKILVCGTCANYFSLTDRVAVGIISNMYDIADTLSRAGHIVQP
ncbi:MAG: sulfurtransferase-like selenium metabolism protein YedF [Deltaproteobacteria bacterium]|nr:sulfurtransferase-like selenium metabolism protein YedF [Deltaproteobacteria bacterium]